MKRYYNSKTFLFLICLFGAVLGLSCDLGTLTPSGIPEFKLSWQQTNGPYGGNVSAITVNSKGHIFAGGSGIYRSLDNGNSWDFSEIKRSYINYLAVNEFNGDIYALAKDDTWYSGDGGETWKRLNNFRIPDDFKCMTFNSNGHIFAGNNSDVYWSIDNGDNWTHGNIYTSISLVSNY